MKFKKILHSTLNEMGMRQIQKSGMISNLFFGQGTHEQMTKERFESYINQMQEDYPDDYYKKMMADLTHLQNFLEQKDPYYKTLDKGLDTQESFERRKAKVQNFYNLLFSFLEKNKPEVEEMSQAARRARGGKKAQNELKQEIEKNGGSAEVVENKKASVDVRAKIEGSTVKRFSQAVLSRFLGQIAELESIEIEIKDFNPVKWDIEAQKGAKVFGVEILDNSKIEVKDTSKTAGSFLYAEVYKISTPQAARKVKREEGKYLEVFNRTVEQINIGIQNFIKTKLMEKIESERLLEDFYLANRISKLNWKIKTVDKEDFVRDVWTKINDGYFQNAGDVPGSVNRIEIFFKNNQASSQDEGIIKEIIALSEKMYSDTTVIERPSRTIGRTQTRTAYLKFIYTFNFDI